jgi:hypothetical protein
MKAADAQFFEDLTKPVQLGYALRRWWAKDTCTLRVFVSPNCIFEDPLLNDVTYLLKERDALVRHIEGALASFRDPLP